MNPTCHFEIFDGNTDDPGYAYCGHRPGHAGDHGDWITDTPAADVDPVATDTK